MAKIINIASISTEGYKNSHCLFCGYFMKIKIFPYNKVIKTVKCTRCKSKFSFQYIETDGDFKLDVSASSAINTKSQIILNTVN